VLLPIASLPGVETTAILPAASSPGTDGIAPRRATPSRLRTIEQRQAGQRGTDTALAHRVDEGDER
jgi:hypothetical protein